MMGEIDWEAMTDAEVETWLDDQCYVLGRYSGWQARRREGGVWDGYGRGHNDYMTVIGTSYQQAIRTIAKHVHLTTPPKEPADE